MSLLEQIFPSVIVAMMVAVGLFSLALFWGKDWARGAIGPFAIGLAYVAGHLVITGWVSFPPADTTNWLPYFALVGAVLSAGCALAATKAWMRVLIFALISTGALRLLLKPKFQYGWSLGEGWLWVGCLTCAFVLLVMILNALGRRPATAIELPAFLLITCAGTFGALMLSGSMLLGQFAAVLGAAVFGSLIYTVRRVPLGRGIVPVFSLLMGTLLVSAYFFAELPAISAVLLIFAPAAAMVPVNLSSKLLAFGVRAVLVSVAVVAGLVLAFRASPALSY